MTQVERDQGVIWITEAMLKYQHSRNWFNKRVADGIFTTAPQPGTSKIYLRVADIEKYLAEHPEEKRG